MQCVCAMLSTVTCLALPHYTHYLINDTIFDKKLLLNIKFVFWFSLHILSETFLVLRKPERNVIKILYWFDVTYPLFLSDFNETEFSRQIFEKYSSIKFHENPFSGSRVFPSGRRDGQIDRKTDTRKAIVVFRNFVKAPKNGYTKQLLVLHQRTHSAVLREIPRP